MLRVFCYVAALCFALLFIVGDCSGFGAFGYLVVVGVLVCLDLLSLLFVGGFGLLCLFCR